MPQNEQLHLTANVSGAVREEIFDGKSYLVAPVVAIRQGVLNGILYLSDDIGQYAYEWNGHVVPLNHPQIEGEYVSANSRLIWANEVVGHFWDVEIEGERLKGDIWIDLEKAEKLGEVATNVVRRLRAGEPIEVSTGVFINVEDTAGIWQGIEYKGIARNIHPDHLALLPDGVGACSWQDGCGTPRVNQKGEPMPEATEVVVEPEVVANEMTLDDRSSVVRMAFWGQVQKSQGLFGQTSSFDGDWDVIAVFDEQVICKDYYTKTHRAFPYQINESTGEVSFGDPTPVNVAYQQVDGGADVVVTNEANQPDQKPASLVARAMRWLRGEDQASEPSESAAEPTESLEANSQEEKDAMTRCEMVANIQANKKNKLSKEYLDAATDETLTALTEMLVDNAEAQPAAAQASAPAESQSAAVAQEAPVIPGLAEMQAAIVGLTETVGQISAALTANANQEKALLVADLVANERCAFDEGDLTAMTMPQLTKLASSLNMPRDYSGAAGAIRSNAGEVKEEVLTMPKPTWAVAGEAK
jgi:hypothetical protein